MNTFLYLCLVLVTVTISCVHSQEDFTSDQGPSSSTTPITIALPNDLLPSALDSPATTPESSIKIVDFVKFDEHLHEAEFVFTFMSGGSTHDKSAPPHPSEEDFLIGPHHSLTQLSSQLTLSDSSMPPKLKLIKRYRVVLKCKTFFSLYPHDSHFCNLQLTLKNGEKWNKNETALCGDLSSFDFHTKGYFTINLPGNTIIVNLILQRTSGTQMFAQMYSPLIMLVCLSFFTMSQRGCFTFRIWSSMACLLGLLIVTSILWNYIPRAGVYGGQTAIEHYIVICVGIVFQIVLTNFLIYGYLSMGQSSFVSDGILTTDLEANIADSPSEKPNGTVVAKLNNNNNSKKESNKIKSHELHILKMGKFHQFVYFKMLKPAKYQLPIAFLIINAIYWTIILVITSGLPKGFLYPPEYVPKSPLDLSCI